MFYILYSSVLVSQVAANPQSKLEEMYGTSSCLDFLVWIELQNPISSYLKKFKVLTFETKYEYLWCFLTIFIFNIANYAKLTIVSILQFACYPITPCFLLHTQ